MDFNDCFERGLDSSNRVVRFRSRLAFNLTLSVDLMDMFERNIGPASSIGDESRDPTLRPIILGSWPGERGGGREKGREEKREMRARGGGRRER